MRLRLHHLLVLIGLGVGAFVGSVVVIGGLGSIRGAFLAAIFSGDALASGPAPRGGRGTRGRPAWFDEDDEAPKP